MSNGKTHQTIGVIAGAATAAYTARNERSPTSCSKPPADARWLPRREGARHHRSPDQPSAPEHRHRHAPVTGVALVARTPLDDLTQKLRCEAEARADLRRSSTSTIDSIIHFIIEMLCRLGAGAAVGFTAGYASHLALDFTTPASLPAHRLTFHGQQRSSP